jgi:starch-binding outer membrane protein, SusD/RagB family
MKISYKKIYRSGQALLLVTAGLFSCQSELLEPTPQTSYPSSAVYDTPQRIEQQVNGLYDAVKDGNFLGSRYLIYNDIRAEEFLNRLTNGVTGLQTWNHTLVESSNEVNNLWLAAYQAINAVNIFLDGMELNKGKLVGPVFADDYATTTGLRYQAEARFLRGITYYYLLQLYAKPYVNGNGNNPGVPLRLNAERGFEGNDLARASVAEVYTQILEDLNFAEANLLANNAATGVAFPASNVTRAHRNAAIAFKTRVYLTMGRWSDVVTEANKLVPASSPFVAASGVPHALSATIGAVFAPPQTTTESILSFPFTTLDAPGTQNQLGYYYLQPVTGKGNGEYYLNPSGIIGNASWKVSDARRAFNVVSSSNQYLNKYPTGSPYTDNSPVIRYAEVLLNLAEANVRASNIVNARSVALLNAVRGRSDATTVFTEAQFTSPAELISAILTERRIEFLGEGLRSSDLMRLNLPIPGKGGISVVNPTDPNYVWPMPSSELNVNTALVRN